MAGDIRVRGKWAGAWVGWDKGYGVGQEYWVGFFLFLYLFFFLIKIKLKIFH